MTAAGRLPARLSALVLAAGSGSRFGGGKARALLDGRPLAAHVLRAARAAGAGRLVLVLGRDASEVAAALVADDPAALDSVVLALNPAPERGLSSSLRAGLAVARAAPGPDGVLVLLGDQPRVRVEVLRRLVAAAADAPAGTLAVAPAYAADEAPNPVLLLPPGWAMADGLSGDRGLARLLAGQASRVVRVEVGGANPDVDTRGDLAALQGRPA